MLKVNCLVVFGILLLLTACSPRMGSIEYAQITDEFIEEMAQYMHLMPEVEIDEEFEEYAVERLEEIAQNYDYSAEDYIEEAEIRGLGWDTLFAEIQLRAGQLEQLEAIDPEHSID